MKILCEMRTPMKIKYILMGLVGYLLCCSCAMTICKNTKGTREICINTCNPEDRCGENNAECQAELSQMKLYHQSTVYDLEKKLKTAETNAQNWKDISNEKTELLSAAIDETVEYQNENRQFKQDIRDLLEQLDNCAKRVDTLKKQIEKLEQMAGK